MTTTLPGQTGGLYAATQDLLREHGVTHRGDVPWALDPLPLVIEAADWAPLEAALVQRTTLLDAILQDLSGEQHLLTSGLLPAEIVASSPAFLRPAAGLRIPGPHQLFSSATDLVRNADGAWTVLSDRTGVPTGMGFAMEDRRVVAQVMAGDYRMRGVRRLGPFFRTMRRSLAEVAPPGATAPRVAVLTPGVDSPNAFDHAYLATMLGVPLVEGEDLVVEDGRLWTRTLEVREPLDVLLRCVDGAWVDPLELRSDSRLGAPGILHAIRQGTLTVVNPIGAGILESPALFTFLPRLARHLLGEELALPSVATYWCGDRSMGAHVVANIHRLVVRSIHSRATIDARHLSLGQRADLCARIASQPWAWVGQEPVEPSESASLTPTGVATQPTGFRMFTVSSGGSWTVMAGALGRVGEVGAAFKDAAKDVWVIALEPAAPPVEEPDARLAPSSVISPRAAEDLYWLGRHLERAESLARLVRVVADRWDDYHGRGADDAGRVALDVLLESLYARSVETPLPRLIHGEEKGTVAHAVGIAHGNARAVADLMPVDAWPAFALVERVVAQVRAQHEGPAEPQGLGASLGRLISGLLALDGLIDDAMVRDAGWYLLDAGRRIERARWVATTLLGHHERRQIPEVERLLVESTLLAHESAMVHRRSSLAGGITGLWDLLLTDPANPRSVAFQVDHLRRALDALPGTRPAMRVLLDDVADLLTEAALRGDVVEDEVRRPLAERLRSIEWRLRALSDEITHTWFSRPEPADWSEGRP